MTQMRIDVPVAVDSDYRIWDAFANSYWPALYFIDAEGRIRHHHFGEGGYEYAEIVLQLLLAPTGGLDRGLVSVDPSGVEAQPDWDDVRSPETYVGYSRSTAFASPGGASPDRPGEYAMPDALPLNRWALAGEWTIGREAATLNASGGRIAHRFHARDLTLVLGPDALGRPVRFQVQLDGEPPGDAHGVDTDGEGGGTITDTRLYQLIRQPARVGEH